MKLDLSAPHQTYLAADGRKLTGVTTYLSVLAKPALLGWYAQMEREGVLAAKGGQLPTKPDGKPLWFAEAKRDRAADLGTVTHARCEAFNIGEELEPDGIPADLYELSVHGFERYKRWMDAEGLTVLKAEEQFVYEIHVPGSPWLDMAYGGTRDVVCEDRQGRRVLVDLKTSKASPYWPYDETYAQVAAYAHPPEARIERIAVVRIGTTMTDEGNHVWLSDGERAAGWDLFCGAYRCYESKKALGRATTAAKKERC